MSGAPPKALRRAFAALLNRDPAAPSPGGREQAGAVSGATPRASRRQSASAAPPNRGRVLGLLTATAVAGLFFSPVFGVRPLLAPVLAVVVVAYLCVEVAARWPGLAPARPVLITVAGLVAVSATVLFPTTVAGLPTAETLRALWHGATDSWLLTLQSTWPARPDPRQLLFVPLATLVAAVLAVELLAIRPLLALLPSLALAGLSQAYHAFDGTTAVLAAAGYGFPAAAVALSASRTRRADPWPVLLTVAAIAAGTVAVAGVDPFDRGAYSLKDDRLAPVRENRVTSPLGQIANRLSTPDTKVFGYRAEKPVALWRLAVLDGFDGADWSADLRPNRLGTRIATPAATTTASADVDLADLTGPWLPSQAIPLDVTGLAPLVDQNTGVLLRDEPGAGDYRLSWAEPTVDATTLSGAPVDPRARGGLGGVGVVPPEIGRLAETAVAGLRPTFQSALQLDRFLRDNYRLAVGDDLPTGHGWPQLRRFLLDTKRGTSEQFAAAYVVLARMNGIPARLAVGFRGDAEADGDHHVVRNRDVLAWPEVAVRGVGWIPLDPTESAESAAGGGERTGLAAVVDRARADLPPERDLRQPELPEDEPTDTAAPATGTPVTSWLLAAATAVAAVLVAWLGVVPLAVALRAGRRRRRTGAAGVLAAWAEVCDRLRGYGVAYRVGMTPRDLAAVTADVAGADTGRAISELGRVVDMALWSGVDVADGHARQAWRRVAEVREGMARRPRTARLRAAVNPRVLFRPGPH